MWRILGFLPYLLLVLLPSCEKVLDTAREDVYIPYQSYYPVSMGFWAEYKIDSTHYIKSTLDPASIVTTHSYFIREQIEDTLFAFDTPYQFRIKVFFRKSLSEPWVFLRNVSIHPLKNEITKNESNLRFTKLYSPVNASVTWRGNKYIDTSANKLYGDWDYRYVDLFRTKVISGISFDSTITVLQHVDSNLIEKTHFFEVYARNVGLVHAERHVLEKQTLENGWDKPENGYSVVVKVWDWKK